MSDPRPELPPLHLADPEPLFLPDPDPGTALTLPPVRKMQPVLIEAGFWLQSRYSDEQLYGQVVFLIKHNRDRISLVQQAMSAELACDDGYQLSRQLSWLDSNLYFIGQLVSDANMLLDLAESHWRVPSGRSVLCTTDEGKLIPAGGKGHAVDPENVDPVKDKKFEPKWQTLTDHDRKTELAAKCVPFRRLRDEYEALGRAMESRMYLGKQIINGITARNRAAGMGDQKH